MVVSTEYYDLLGVKPTANDEEIRRGYLRQARKWHPDKNAGNLEAEERFKAISDAYKVLMDPQMRVIYDEKGKEATAEAQSHAGVDPVEQTTELCRALFGFGKFETIFGDPTTFPLFVVAVRMMTRMSYQSSTEIDAPPEVREQLDRAEMEKAEAAEKDLIRDLVVILKQKVKNVTRECESSAEYKDFFTQICMSEAEYLSNSPGGDDLVASVGYIYAQEAKQHMGRYLGVEKVWSELEERGHQLGQKVELIRHGLRLLTASSQLQKEMEKAEQGRLEGDQPDKITYGADRKQNDDSTSTSDGSKQPAKPPGSSNGGPGTSGAGGRGPSFVDAPPTQQKLMERVVAEGLSALWKLGKFLIEERVRKICETLLADPDATKQEKSAWAMALLQMGQTYQEIAEQMKKHHAATDARDDAQAAYGLPKFR
eukprot:comp18295_c1_seq1/m.19332 comp18295_c1_seq1/g.19332  ORF comp18295_c1_seq1/g.19332 comp18295_c1_seq1/m.19332 type:complete len:426 (-) comp18295_c1_seq1:176-1453(-)